LPRLEITGDFHSSARADNRPAFLPGRIPADFFHLNWQDPSFFRYFCYAERLRVPDLVKNRFKFEDGFFNNCDTLHLAYLSPSSGFFFYRLWQDISFVSVALVTVGEWIGIQRQT